MRLRILSALPVLVLALLALPASADWRQGFATYTPVNDIYTGYLQNGTGYLVSQSYIAHPPQPVVGQPYYVSVYMTGIGTPAVGRYMAAHIALPAGTSVVADPAIPVRCFYRARNGQGAQYEFTNQIVNDMTYPEAPLRIYGCPQPSQQAFPLVNLSSGAGTALRIERRDPQGANALWPMPAQASYEFLIPLVSTQPLDGLSDAARLIAPIQSIQGELGDPWSYPLLPLLVHPGAAPPQADLRATLALGTGAPGNTRVIGRCTNHGPDSAANASCSFDGLPANAIASCAPAGTQASLGGGAFIECSAEFPSPVTAINLSLQASSTTADPVTGNNSATVHIAGTPLPQADLRASLVLGQGAPGQTRVIGRCTNFGPDAASNASCGFGALPANAVASCAPAGVQASLGLNAFIECTADFPTPVDAVAVSVSAASGTQDPVAGNDSASLQVPGTGNPPPVPQADLRTSLVLGQGQPGETRVIGRCTNFGPDAATGVACGFTGLPQGARVACSPAGVQASLGLNQFIECSADFANQAAALSIGFTADSSTSDPSPGNDTIAIDVPGSPGGEVPLLQDGFEPR